MISSRRDGNINKRTKLKSFLTLDRRSVSPHRPACVRALCGQWAIWLAPRLSLATESTGTVLIRSQMSEIAGHEHYTFTKHERSLAPFPRGKNFPLNCTRTKEDEPTFYLDSYTRHPHTQTLPRSQAARELYFSANSDILMSTAEKCHVSKWRRSSCM